MFYTANVYNRGRMALVSDEKETQETSPVVGFNLTNPWEGAVYTNDSHANVLGSEVVITFGDSTKEPDGHLKAVAKVMMSHATFMGFVEYLESRYEFIREAFGERPKSMGEAFNENPERVTGLMKKYLSVPREDTDDIIDALHSDSEGK